MRHIAWPARLAALALLIFANSQLFAQDDSIYRLPAGTKLTLRMDAEVNSHVASVNDTFLAYVARPVRQRDAVVVPENTVVEGRVTQVTPASGGGDGGSLDVVFETMRFDTLTRKIEAVPVNSYRGGSKRKIGVLSILGGIAAGALVGSGTSGRGTLIGAGVGAGVGSIIALAAKGKELRLKKGQEFEIELRKELIVPAIDY